MGLSIKWIRPTHDESYLNSLEHFASLLQTLRDKSVNNGYYVTPIGRPERMITITYKQRCPK